MRRKDDNLFQSMVLKRFENAPSGRTQHLARSVLEAGSTNVDEQPMGSAYTESFTLCKHLWRPCALHVEQPSPADNLAATERILVLSGRSHGSPIVANRRCETKQPLALAQAPDLTC